MDICKTFTNIVIPVDCIDVLQKLDLTPEEQALLYAYTVLTAGLYTDSYFRIIGFATCHVYVS